MNHAESEATGVDACRCCGFAIEEDEQRCAALDDGGAGLDPSPSRNTVYGVVGVSQTTESADGWSVIDAVSTVNQEFQQHAGSGADALLGIAGYHALFNHDRGIDHAGQAALHAALDDVLMEVSLDQDIVRQNKGEITPRTMAEELREQLHTFTYLNDRFVDRLGDRFESTFRGYQEDIEEGSS